jgi:hypothetical protein
MSVRRRFSRTISQNGVNGEPRTRRLALVAVVAAAATVLVSVAAGSGDDDAVQAAAVAAPNPPTMSETYAMRAAEEILTSRCMAAHGFTYVVPDLQQPPQEEPRNDTYGSDDVGYAAAHGFGLTEQQAQGALRDRAQADNPNAKVLNALSPSRRAAWEVALSGTGRDVVGADTPGVGEVFTNADGCTADARRELYGDLATWGRTRMLATNLSSLVYPKVVSDPRYVAGLAQWRTCMKRAGLSYDSPAEATAAAGDGYDKTPGEAARSAEIRIVRARYRAGRGSPAGRTRLPRRGASDLPRGPRDLCAHGGDRLPQEPGRPADGARTTRQLATAPTGGAGTKGTTMANLHLRLMATAALSAGALLAAPAVSANAAPSAPSASTSAAAASEIEWDHGGAPTGTCQSGALCAYQDSYYGGNEYNFKLNNKRWSDTSNRAINDKSSSWYNNGTQSTFDSVYIYTDVDYQGAKVCLDRGWGIKHYPSLSDKVSSDQWVNGPCPS